MLRDSTLRRPPKAERRWDSPMQRRTQKVGRQVRTMRRWINHHRWLNQMTGEIWTNVFKDRHRTYATATAVVDSTGACCPTIFKGLCCLVFFLGALCQTTIAEAVPEFHAPAADQDGVGPNLIRNQLPLTVIPSSQSSSSSSASSSASSNPASDQNQAQAPRFVAQPSGSGSGIVVGEGQNKILQCQALGVPQPDYRWLKGGRYLGEYTTEYFYRIQSIRRNDAGDYKCIARNSVGAIFSEKGRVTVAYMSPVTPKENQTLALKQGEAAILRLPDIDSQPSPTVQWMTRDGPIYGLKYATTKDNALVILSTAPSDSRVYWAQITNTHLGQEQTSGHFSLQVSQSSNFDNEIAPQMLEPPKDAEIVKGTESFKLECIANARPLEQLQTIWRKDGRAIHRSGIQYTIGDLWNRTLTLMNVEPSHSGNYECEVRLGSAKRGAVKAAANITVFESPQIVEGPVPVVEAEYGTSVTLQCRSTGFPRPTVTWYRNTVVVGTVDVSGRFEVGDDDALTIKNLRMSDSGIFQCIPSNSVGETTGHTWLRVKTSKPVMKNPPLNATVYDGKDVQLVCEASGAPKPNVTWFHDGDRIRSAGRIQVLDSGTLLIAAAQTNDEGGYTCVQANSEGETSVTAHIAVLVRTQISRPPVDTKVILGNTAVLQCRVSNDVNVRYTLDWLFQDKLLTLSPGGRFNVNEDGTLEIREARNVDIGNYTCKVVSPGGNDTRSARLDVVELPYPPTDVQAELIPGVTKNVNISWIPGFHGNSPIQKYLIQKRIMAAHGIPREPYTDWQPAMSNVTGDQRSVLIMGLKPALSYQFRVIAVNGVGEGNPSEPSIVLVLPQEPPSGPPLSVVGSPRSSTSIIMQWQPPDVEDRNGELRGYVIRYRLASYRQGTWSTRNITTEAQRSYPIDDLITWREYEIQIAAFNDKGVGVFSYSIRVRTKEGVPLSAPTDVRIDALSSTSIQVRWHPPDPQLINGVNQGYKIQAWKGKPSNSSVPFRTTTVLPSPVDPLAEQVAIVTELEKYKEYAITVLCFTHPGNGKLSDPVYVRTNQDVPDIVANFTIDEVKDRSVHVHWGPPGYANGILLGYILRFRIRDEPNSEIQRNLSVSTLNLLVDNLRPTTFYTFEIFAFTVVGAGPSRMSTILSGIPPVLPEAATRLAVSNIEAFAVLLQFTPGFDGNASVSRWTVEAQVGRNLTWGPAYDARAVEGTQAFEVQNLIPFMEYRLRLISNNIVGASPPSEPSRTFQTLQAPPHRPPQSVTVRAMGPTSIRVRWTPLPQVEWHGIPRGYNISYRRHWSEVNEGDKSKAPLRSVMLENHNANFFVIEELDEFVEYEVTVEAYNDVGSSPPSPTVIERTRESAPSAGPADVAANATSSTTILVSWGEIPTEKRNGIIEGYKVYYGAKAVPTQFKSVPSNSTLSVTLTRLKKYVLYNVQVLAYTRMGDGALSATPIKVRTFEDVPGVPSNVSFPDVSQTMARIVWDSPEEPNGVITDYRITYQLNGSQTILFNETFLPSERTHLATGLVSEKYYLFTITAKTSLGWGKAVSVLVFTKNSREAPEPPSKPRVSQSQIQSDKITFTWSPGRDGFAPLRYYTIQQVEEDELWQMIPECVDPGISYYIARNLKPFTKYKFRIQATNDIGSSGWSPESNYTKTLPASPAKAPMDVAVVPITTTSVRVTWKPLESDDWNGDQKSGGYRVEYHQTGEFVAHYPKETKRDPEAGEVHLKGLARDKTYDVVVVPFNSQGDGPKTSPVTIYVGEAVPTGEPLEVKAKTLSSTSIHLAWRPPLENHQNGELQGYKIYYLPSGESKETEEMEVVPPSSLALELLDLKRYTQYHIQILAFNPAGDGPRSAPLEVLTAEDVPGPPANLQFLEITMTSLRVTWNKPENPNGHVRGYVVTYETLLPNENFSKQVRQRVNTTSIAVHGLEETATYTFSVMAVTSMGQGPPAVGNVTTGPQSGSPDAPLDLTLSSSMSSVVLRWKNGLPGDSPITSYVVECLKQDESRWQEVARTSNGVTSEETVSFQNLLPSTNYRFRLFVVNTHGISLPSESAEWIAVPEKYVQTYSLLRRTPFYRELWFVVAVAAGSLIIIILVVAVLCVKTKTYKYKRESDEIHIKSSQEMDKLSMDDGGFATFELRQSSHGTLRKNTLSRKNGKLLNGAVIAKSPPRPSPRSVTYSDEEDLKGYGYDDNCDDSSLTEKPSEVSSTDSQASESDVDSVKWDPHSFVNHYANVNDTLRQSWSRQRPTKAAYSSYTDSEPEGSVAVSLNAGHIIMNNMAGSRAPLPGFSSFV